MATQYASNPIEEIPIRNFSGGLNTRDLASEIGDKEFVDSLNVTIDERGGIQKRLGYEKRYVNAIGTGLVSNAFYWGTRNQFVYQIGSAMHLEDGAAFTTWTTDARVGMTEFLGSLFMIHPIDGWKVYDGTTITSSGATPKGNSAATWQNRVWTNDVTNKPRVNFTDLGAFVFSVNNWVDIREKDSNQVRCLAGASGLDVSGRPGLLVFKDESAYRIFDGNTGDYNTIDASQGCGSNIGAVSVYGRTYVASPAGIFYTDGLSPLVDASALLLNFFHPDQINQTRTDLYCAGRRADRLYFSFPRAGQSYNSVAVEVHPLAGWIAPHSNAASCYAYGGVQEEQLVMGAPVSQGRVYNSHVGGSDDGAAIASHFQSRWLIVNNGNKTRIRRMRVVGRGIFNLYLYKDWELGASGAARSVDISSTGFNYDAPGSTYDLAGVVYGPTSFQGHQDFWSIGVARSVGFRIEETSTLTQSGREVIDGTLTPEEGAWSLSHVSFMAINLGIR